MRSYPIGNDEKKELELLKAEDWQINCLKLNPDYVYWGNKENYMINGKSWSERVYLNSVKDLWELNDYNELINFYFEVNRENHRCPACDGTNLNTDTKKIYNDWYTHLRTDGKEGWEYDLTEVEIKELVKAGRLTDLMGINCYYDEESGKWIGYIDGKKKEVDEPKYPTPREVNNWAKTSFGHDSINRWICTEARAKHLGVYGHCENCDEGYIYTEPKAKLSLQMWFIHPRKGASRGVYLNEIKEDELPIVLDYLREARDRNAARFSKL